MPRRFRKRAPRRNRRKARLYRKMKYNPQPTFTETWDAGQLTVPVSGILPGTFSMTFTSLPQAAQYRNLYKQFRILRNTWILVPRYNSVDPNGSFPAYASGRMAYAITNTAGQAAPTTEINVLERNGSRVLVAMDKIIKISHVPVPILNVSNSIATSVFLNKSRVWLNTSNSTNGGSGETVTHGSVAYFITVPSLTTPSDPLVLFDVYCKTTVQFKDPA